MVVAVVTAVSQGVAQLQTVIGLMNACRGLWMGLLQAVVAAC